MKERPQASRSLRKSNRSKPERPHRYKSSLRTSRSTLRTLRSLLKLRSRLKWNPTVLHYAITDRHLHPGSETDRREALIQQAIRLAKQGVDFLQIREKDLTGEDLLHLTDAIWQAVADTNEHIRILLNAPLALALQANVHGVHLTSTALVQRQTAALPAIRPHPSRPWLISVSCHTAGQVQQAKTFADLILFAPVFEKPLPSQQPLAGSGLAVLANACSIAAPTPVLALGGVTTHNTAACLAAGAAGIAGIRLFLHHPAEN